MRIIEGLFMFFIPTIEETTVIIGIIRKADIYDSWHRKHAKKYCSITKYFVSCLKNMEKITGFLFHIFLL